MSLPEQEKIRELEKIDSGNGDIRRWIQVARNHYGAVTPDELDKEIEKHYAYAASHNDDQCLQIQHLAHKNETLAKELGKQRTDRARAMRTVDELQKANGDLNARMAEAEKELTQWRKLGQHFAGSGDPGQAQNEMISQHELQDHNADQLKQWRKLAFDFLGVRFMSDARRELLAQQDDHNARIAELNRWQKMGEDCLGSSDIDEARAELQAMRQDVQTHNEQERHKVDRIRRLESDVKHWREQYNGAMQYVHQVERDNEDLTFQTNVLASEAVQWRQTYEALANARAVVAAAQPMTMTVSIQRAVDLGLVSSDTMSLTEVLDYLMMDIDPSVISLEICRTLSNRIEWLRNRSEGKDDASPA